MAEYFFWFFLILTLYPYVIYPLLVSVWSKVAPRAWTKGTEQPTVTLIVSVYNEEGVIQRKLDNALALDYPPERLQIMVVSDGSTDTTHEIVGACDDERVILKAYQRAGKTACLNRAVAEASGDIVVFTDANSMFPPQALQMMTRNFADESVGLVTGWTRYRRSGSDVEEAPGAYARLEKITKDAESRISSCVGADGAIFAIRKELYQPLEDQDINDFVIPLNVIGQRRRVVLDGDVYCLEEPSEDAGKEYRRQVRMTNRTLGAMRRNLKYLVPVDFGSFAFFLLSHKLLRFLVPFFVVGTFFSGLALMTSTLFYGLAFLAMILLVLAGSLGLMGYAQSRLVDVCATFLLTCAGQAVGWFRFFTGKKDTMWTPQRS
ncbi:glycosyltransferase family 2 protein [Pelovirga terrestris]|uniref:Glycosyltransferase family 2 protein n=1 Tax=Pelovirga terrestris TaxID=2771352 RepID=A0A8J6UND2_9BACT|nr:glycosyltransferase family 2 protein [Pelovirga terrestris]MBD1399329.1 glycosyltransferase family 2 protein [Pelovirga terrestris]